MTRAALLLLLGFVLLVVAVTCSPGTSEVVATSTPTGSTTAIATAEIPSPTPPPPIARATATMIPRSIAATPAAGTLAGHARIGPLTPVERVGVPTPTPAPQVCTSRGLAIYASDGSTLVTSFSFQPDCSYQVALPPGTYVVRLKDTQRGIGGSKNLPKTVTIESGQTVVLDVDIDTGIR